MASLKFALQLGHVSLPTKLAKRLLLLLQGRRLLCGELRGHGQECHDVR